jgi:tetratricopeptide (TPR) repeat protein
MGKHHRKITTSVPLAQEYFDQGLVWAYAFNHDEAIRSFQQAARLDPRCPMAWWGIALCNGPHINNPSVSADRAANAWTAVQEALARIDQANDVERDLIRAQAKRFADPPPSDRRELDRQYAQAMAGVWEKHRNDADVGALYAEALMDLQPWDLWTSDGQMKPGTERIVTVLEEVLRLDRNHPGANHLFVHAIEASSNPQRADAAADRLRRSVPASGHLVHMPSHIDVLTGRWRLAAEQNERAIEIDRLYREISPRQGFYHVYMLHNDHMLAFVSMMEGRSDEALRAARRAVKSVPQDYLQKEAGMFDPYMGAVYDVLKRFGRWDDILAEPAPPSYLPITTALWRYARALAFAAEGRLEEATREQELFRAAVSNVPKDATMAINRAHDILRIAEEVLLGELALARGRMDESISALRQAVAWEDTLLYMEPPEWIQPTRHTLGAVLLAARRYEEAETVYREDLKNWPGNGWSLYGLSRALDGQGETAEAGALRSRFRKAWKRADTSIASSCLCIPET